MLFFSQKNQKNLCKILALSTMIGSLCLSAKANETPLVVQPFNFPMLNPPAANPNANPRDPMQQLIQRLMVAEQHIIALEQMEISRRQYLLSEQAKFAELSQRFEVLDRIVKNQDFLSLNQNLEQLRQSLSQQKGMVEEQSFTQNKFNIEANEKWKDLREALISTQKTIDAQAALAQENLKAYSATQNNTNAALNEMRKTMAGFNIAQTSLQGDVLNINQQLNTLNTKLNSQPNVTVNTSATNINPENNQNNINNNLPVDPPTITATPLNEKAAYDQAFSALRAEKYDEAIELWREFLRNFPNSKRTDNALYWAAESEFAMNNYKEANLAYETLLRDYPNSAKASMAALKLGDVAVSLNNIGKAEAIFNQVITQYAGSEAANLAKQRLENLRR